MLGAIVLFAIGLLIGGSAHSMAVRIAPGGEGLGRPGAEVVAIDSSCAGLPAAGPAAASALISAVWVVPSMVGQLVAGW